FWPNWAWRDGRYLDGWARRAGVPPALFLSRKGGQNARAPGVVATRCAQAQLVAVVHISFNAAGNGRKKGLTGQHALRPAEKVGGNMRNKLFAAIAAAAFAATSFALAGAAFAQQPIVIKFSHVVSPDAPKGKAAVVFKEL